MNAEVDKVINTDKKSKKSNLINNKKLNLIIHKIVNTNKKSKN